MARLTDRPDMTLDVYRGRKTTTQHNNEFTGRAIALPPALALAAAFAATLARRWRGVSKMLKFYGKGTLFRSV